MATKENTSTSTNKGTAVIGRRPLSGDEQMLIDAFPHLEPSMRKLWLSSASDALEAAERQNKSSVTYMMDWRQESLKGQGKGAA